jgi:hypothetical protein
MDQHLPFTISSRPWQELSEKARSFFCEDLAPPLCPEHAAQISLLAPADAARLFSWAAWSIPAGWPDRTEDRFEHEELLSVYDCWNDEAGRASVARWLFNRGIPFRRTVYLMYERDRVVQTTWRMVVRYWKAFAWSVGYDMIAVDHTLQWACCFHHEDVFVFGSHRDRRRTSHRT